MLYACSLDETSAMWREPGTYQWPDNPCSSILPIYLESREFADRNLGKANLNWIEYVQFDSFGMYASTDDTGIGVHVLGKMKPKSPQSSIERFVQG